MALETATDLAAMMDTEDAAEVATLADGCTFSGRFHQAFVESFDFNGRRPALLCITAQIPTVAVDTVLTINNNAGIATAYRVAAIEKGDRTSVLMLELT
jgi:hypothetical protein